MTCGFDVNVFMQERSQQASVAGEAVDRTAETTGSSEGGAVGDPLVPVGRADSDSSAASATDTDQGNGDNPSVVLSVRTAHGLSGCWGRVPVTTRAGPEVRADG